MRIKEYATLGYFRYSCITGKIVVLPSSICLAERYAALGMACTAAVAGEVRSKGSALLCGFFDLRRMIKSLNGDAEGL